MILCGDEWEHREKIFKEYIEEVSHKHKLQLDQENSPRTGYGLVKNRVDRKTGTKPIQNGSRQDGRDTIRRN